MSEAIWLKEIDCPCCGAKFKTPRMRSSKLKVKAMDSDFHKVYDQVNPMFYAITSCPVCNYSARNEDFSKALLDYHPEVKNVASAIKTSGRAVKFSQHGAVEMQEAVNKHLLAISFYKNFKPENPNTISGLLMHVAWMFREAGNAEKEKEYLGKAVEYYIKTFEKGSFIPEKMGEPGIMYLIGELYRRMGEKNEAVKWFSKALQCTQISDFPNIASLAHDAWEKITEEKKANK